MTEPTGILGGQKVNHDVNGSRHAENHTQVRQMSNLQL
jgi:hypothetical protein